VSIDIRYTGRRTAKYADCALRKKIIRFRTSDQAEPALSLLTLVPLRSTSLSTSTSNFTPPIFGLLYVNLSLFYYLVCDFTIAFAPLLLLSASPIPTSPPPPLLYQPPPACALFPASLVLPLSSIAPFFPSLGPLEPLTQ
jgi:hypothetical protein